MRSVLQTGTLFSALAMLSAAQSELPPERLKLVQIRQRMRQNQARIPNYTCLETISRSVRASRAYVISRDGGPGRFLPRDTIRLEVANVGGKEFFARPGALNFTETRLSTFITDGMIGNGVFALFAQDIFNAAIASYRFAGESDAGGRRLLRYHFEVTLLLSHYVLHTHLGEATVAYSGAIWADPQTLDTVRLDIQADNIPPNLGLLSSTTRIDYATVRLGAEEVLLPQSAEMTMRLFNGREDRNNIAFTHCKEYGVASTISYEAPKELPSVAPPPQKEIEIPPGLTLTTSLTTALSSATTAVGDVVHARVESDVWHKKAVLIPRGTSITGRIRRLDQYLARTRYFVVSLEFYRLEFPRGPVRFFAEIGKISSSPGGVSVARVEKNELPGVATFSIDGDSLRLPPGTRMTWKSSRYSP